MTIFQGFSDRALELYAGLEADNSREYWAQHKAVYESDVRDPMLALLGELEDEFGPGKLFRPHRDTRFSKDKTPYKTHQGAFVGETLGVGYYLQLDADGLLAGGGWRAHEPGQVERYRQAVDEPAAGEELASIMGTLRGSGFDVNGDELKTRPRGLPGRPPAAGPAALPVADGQPPVRRAGLAGRRRGAGAGARHLARGPAAGRLGDGARGQPLSRQSPGRTVRGPA